MDLSRAEDIIKSIGCGFYDIVESYDMFFEGLAHLRRIDPAIDDFDIFIHGGDEGPFFSIGDYNFTVQKMTEDDFLYMLQRYWHPTKDAFGHTAWAWDGGM